LINISILWNFLATSSIALISISGFPESAFIAMAYPP